MFGFVAVFLVLLLISTLAQRWSEQGRLRRRLREAPRVDIRALPEGKPARIVGTVTAQATLRAPLTGRTCVAYVAVVEERVTAGKSWHWKRRIHEEKHVPFAVDDGTGRALVDPGAAKLLVEMDSTSRSGTFDDATPVEADFLRRHGKSSQGWFFNRTLRYVEGVIEPGERVAVLGVAVREPDPEAVARVTGYRDDLPTRLRVGGTRGQPIIVSDHLDTTR